MGKQMRKVWYDIEIEDPEEKRHEDKDEEVKKKTVILDAAGDSHIGQIESFKLLSK